MGGFASGRSGDPHLDTPPELQGGRLERLHLDHEDSSVDGAPGVSGAELAADDNVGDFPDAAAPGASRETFGGVDRHGTMVDPLEVDLGDLGIDPDPREVCDGYKGRGDRDCLSRVRGRADDHEVDRQMI
jgi:hypothetical protein